MPSKENGDVENFELEALAKKVAEELYEGNWEDELITREIATSVNRAEAVRRLTVLRREVSRAIELVLKDVGP